MKTVNFSDEIPETYITVKYKGKERQMRRFAEVVSTDKFGQTRVIRPAEYLYINKDGKNKTEFTKNPSRSTGNKEKK